MDWLTQFISPSRIDEYEKYKSGIQYRTYAGEDIEYTTAMFIDKLLRLDYQSKYVAAEGGTAVHEMFEKISVGGFQEETIAKIIYALFMTEEQRRYDPVLRNLPEFPPYVAENSWQVKCNGLSHYLYGCDKKALYQITSPDLEREIPIEATIAGLEIKGTVDAIDNTKIPICVHDIKTTKAIDLQHYQDSWQWRFYLYMTKNERFRYDVFQVERDIEEKIVIIKDYAYLNCWTYPTLNEEVENITRDYYTCLKALEPCFHQRISEYIMQEDNNVTESGKEGFRETKERLLNLTGEE